MKLSSWILVVLSTVIITASPAWSSSSANSADVDLDGLLDEAEAAVCGATLAPPLVEPHGARCAGDDLVLEGPYLRVVLVESVTPGDARPDGYAASVFVDVRAFGLSPSVPLEHQDEGFRSHEIALFWEGVTGCGHLPFLSAISARADATRVLLQASQGQVCADTRFSSESFAVMANVHLSEHLVMMEAPVEWAVPLDIRFGSDNDADGIPTTRTLTNALIAAPSPLTLPGVSISSDVATWDSDDAEANVPVPLARIALDGSNVPLPAQAYICQELEEERVAHDGQCSGQQYYPPSAYYVSNFDPLFTQPLPV